MPLPVEGAAGELSEEDMADERWWRTLMMVMMLDL